MFKQNNNDNRKRAMKSVMTELNVDSNYKNTDITCTGYMQIRVFMNENHSTLVFDDLLLIGRT